MNSKSNIKMNSSVDVLSSIIRTSDALSRYLQIELRQQGHGFSPIQFAITNALYLHDGHMTPTQLSKWVFRSKHTITSDINTLEKRGYVRREAGRNRRSVQIVLTKEGLNKIMKMLPDAHEISSRALLCFDKDEARTFTTLHKQFRKHLDEQISISQGHKGSKMTK